MGTCVRCGSHLALTDRYCPACESPNVGGKLQPRFRSRLSDVPAGAPEVVGTLIAPVGTPLCPRCGHPEPAEPEYCSACGMSMAGAARCGLDGPSDGVWLAPGPHGTEVYRPLWWRTVVLRALLLLAVLVCAAAALAGAGYYADLSPLPDVPVPAPTLSSWLERLDVILLGVAVAVYVALVWWTSRAYRNLPPMQLRGLRVSTRVARVVLLVPVVNLVAVKVLTDDCWRSGDPRVGYRSTGWRRLRVPSLWHFGWGWLVAGALAIVLSALALQQDTAYLPTLPAALSTAGHLLVLLGCAVLAAQVEQVADRQAARVQRLGTSPRPRPFGAVDPEVPGEDEVSPRFRQRRAGAPVWGSY